MTKTSDNEWTKQKKKPSYCRKRMDTILRCSRIHDTEWSDHRYAQVILYGTRGCGRIAGTINSTSAHRRGWIARTITHKCTTVQANREGSYASKAQRCRRTAKAIIQVCARGCERIAKAISLKLKTNINYASRRHTESQIVRLANLTAFIRTAAAVT